jgi:UDP-N-acetyl-D-mannosaminuronic acid dehydrogenase
VVQTTPVQAELAKIWTNILRYATFALPNLLMMDAEQYGANVFEIIDLINRDYPRGGMAQPGLTAGTCLRKDFAFSEERSHAPGMLLAVSRVHESVPLFLVEGVKRRLGSLSGKKVAVLGLAFKADTDDERDSLAHKLVRLLERELADVAVHDPHVASPTQPFDEAVRDADAVVVATNHPEFRTGAALDAIASRAGASALVVDPWDLWGAGQVFAHADELVQLAGGPRPATASI